MGNIVQESDFRVAPQDTSYSSLVRFARKMVVENREWLSGEVGRSILELRIYEAE
jgi:hypothetical protein